MWYKKGMLIWGKYGMILILYVFSIILTVVYAPTSLIKVVKSGGYSLAYTDRIYWESFSLYDRWAASGALLLVATAILAGLDTLANQKFFSKAGLMLTMYTTANLAMWWIEQFPRRYNSANVIITTDSKFQRITNNEVLTIPTSFNNMLGLLAGIALLGLVILAGTTFIASFAQNVVLRIVAFLAFGLVYIQGLNYSFSDDSPCYNFVAWTLMALMLLDGAVQSVGRKEL